MISVRRMCQLALLIAITIVISRFGSITTPITRIGFTFAPVVLCAILYGPVPAALVYVIADLLGAFIFYGYALPGITLSCLLRGLFFGFILHGVGRTGLLEKPDGLNAKKAATWVRIVIAALVDSIVFGLFVNSFWLGLSQAGLSFGEATMAAYTAAFTTRLLQTVIMVPVQIIIIPLLIVIAHRLRKASVA